MRKFILYINFYMNTIRYIDVVPDKVRKVVFFFFFDLCITHRSHISRWSKCTLSILFLCRLYATVLISFNACYVPARYGEYENLQSELPTAMITFNDSVSTDSDHFLNRQIVYRCKTKEFAVRTCI